MHLEEESSALCYWLCEPCILMSWSTGPTCMPRSYSTESENTAKHKVLPTL